MNPIPVPFILTISLSQLHSILLQLFLITIRVLMSIYLLILFRTIWSVLTVSSQHFYSIIHSCYCRAISSFFHTISKWFWVWLEYSLDSLWWDLHTLCMETMLTSSSLFKSIKFTLNSVHSTFDASIDELQFMIWNKDDAIATLSHTIHTIFRLGLDSSLWYIHHLWIQQFWGYGECGSLKLHLSPISSLQRGILCFCHCSQNHR